MNEIAAPSRQDRLLSYRETVLVSHSRHVADRARELLGQEQWAEGTRKSDGMRFYIFRSSRPGEEVFYFTRLDGVGCTCPAARLSRRSICAHKVAAQIRMVEAREAATERREPLVRYEDLTDAL